MAQKSVFFQLQKAELEKRQVWGKAALEQPDSTRPPEIMDYARSKPHFKSWSENVRKSSGGKSLGNVRAMHGGQFLAVGKVIAMSFDDANKAVKIGVEVVDDAAWEKVQKGVYTGFSIGGRYGDRWPDQSIEGATRYEAIPNEISLVDVPCMPGATFEVLKADGRKEMRKFMMDEENDQIESNEASAEENFDSAEPTDEVSAETSEPGTEEGSDNAEGTGEVEKGDPESDVMASESEDVGEQQSLTMESVRSMVVDLLLQLGLVQPAENVSSEEGSLAMSIKTKGLKKSVTSAWRAKSAKIETIDARLTKAQAQLDPLAKQFGMMKADLGKILDAVETLEKRGSSGPVVRDLGAISPQSMADMQKVAVLRDMLKDASPSTRQALETEISRLEIKAIQQNKITL